MKYWMTMEATLDGDDKMEATIDGDDITLGDVVLHAYANIVIWIACATSSEYYHWVNLYENYHSDR